MPADVAAGYLLELPETWAKARGGTGRALVADTLFERIDVLGLREATAHLTANAVRHGLAAALPEEVGISVSGRGERTRPDKPVTKTSPSPSRAARGVWLRNEVLRVQPVPSTRP